MVAAMQLSDLLLLIGFYLNKHLKQLKWQTRQKLAEKNFCVAEIVKMWSVISNSAASNEI